MDMDINTDTDMVTNKKRGYTKQCNPNFSFFSILPKAFRVK